MAEYNSSLRALGCCSAAGGAHVLYACIALQTGSCHQQDLMECQVLLLRLTAADLLLCGGLVQGMEHVCTHMK